MRKSPLLLLLPSVLCLCAPTANAKECAPAAAAHLRTAVDIQRTLRDFDALLNAAQVTGHIGDRAAKLTASNSLRHTVVMPMQSNLIGGGKCDDENLIRAGGGDIGFLLSTEDLSSKRKLTVMGLGNLSNAKIEGDEESKFTTYGGLVGVRAQLNSWLLLGAARYVSTTTTNGLAKVAPDNGYFVEVGIPRWAVLARFLITKKELNVIPDLQLGNIPLGDDRTGAIVVRRVKSEGRHIATSTVTIPISEEAGMKVELDAELAFESAPSNLRHARLRVRNTLLDTQRDSLRLGARIQQELALSVHRGTLVQEVSDVVAAVGGEYRVMAGLDSKYFYYQLDLGLSINRPELLDLIPHAANQLEVRFGNTFGRRW